MKKIKLPITSTFSQTFDMQNVGKGLIVDGKKLVHLGTINVAEAQPEFEIVRENGAQILYGVLSNEQKIETIIANYLFGSVLGEAKPERDFFLNHILQTDKMTFASKKKLLDKIADKHDFLVGKDKDALRKNLDAMLVWRNAFAHGHLIRDNSRGFLLNYFSGEKKVLPLSDDFWQKAEGCFKETNELFNRFDERFSLYLLDKFHKR